LTPRRFTRELFNILTRDAVVPADEFDPETTYTTAEIPPVGQRFANSTYAGPFDAYADGHLLEITTGGIDTETVEVTPAPSVVAAPPTGPLNSDLRHAATGKQLDSGAGIGPFNALAYAAPADVQSIDTQAPLLVAASGTVAGEMTFSGVPAGNYAITLAAHDTEATAAASVTVAEQPAADNGYDSPTDVDAAFIKAVTTDEGEATAATAQQTIAAIRAGEIGPATTREIINLLRS